MMRHVLTITVVLFAASLVAAQGVDLGTDQQRAAGKVLYDKYCSQCHGVTGDGLGVAAPYVKPKPRDFTAGKYKIRTTPSGALPTHQDLKDIIRDGMPYSSMPAWPIFTDAQLDELAYYIKTFSEEFANPDSVAQSIEISSPPAITEESIEEGRKIYGELGCAGCHGQLGRGDGRSAATLKDDWGNHLMPVDMTKRWTFRGGPTRQDVFRAFSTGLNGTPMPSYYESLDEENRWHLVNYIDSLGWGDDPGYDAMVTAAKVTGGIDFEREDLFAAASPAFFPVVGQIMEPGREFWPSVNGIQVKAVYNESEIALELKWHDMRAETSGTNAPDRDVPTFELDPFRGEAAGSASAGDGDDEGGFWGDEVEDEGGDIWGDEAIEEDEGDFWGEEAAEEEGDFWGEDEGAAAGPSGPDNEFSDAVAIQLPLQIPSGIRKPYFIFGDPQNPVDLWFLDLAGEDPEQYTGKGSELLESQGMGDLEARAAYDQGEWTVVFKRPLRSAGGVPLDEGLFVPIAFSVWDGFNRERGNKRGLTQWVYLYLESGGKESPVGPMMRAAGLALLIELLVVFFLRRKYAGGLPAERTPDISQTADGRGPA